MPRTKSTPGQMNLLEARTSTAPCVPAIRAAVQAWRDGGCKGITGTTRTLLDFWFKTDHRLPNGRAFTYHYAQREAIETLIYLYEVAKVRRQKDLIEKYSTDTGLKLLKHDNFARYALKMATGSGKTKVLSLAIAWQFFNAVLESGDDYAKTFLLLAPNVIVYERLRTDFGGGRIFRADPVIPPALSLFWDFDSYTRGEGERAGSDGALYLTNVQQLYERGGSEEEENADPMTAILGPKPPTKKIEVEDFTERIAARPGHCMALNDEAHHTHDEESEWNAVLRRLSQSLTPCSLLQLDVTATPRHSKGQLFSWTVYDYPLKQAILDNIVKRPMKGVVSGIAEAPSDIASVRYKAFLTAGVERWREYREQLAPLGKRPLLFVMMNDTTEADDVASALRDAYPEDFAGDKLLVIHTDRSGEVSTKDLEKARQTAREVDDATSPVNAIVSVLMLREGWDVQNVTVIVGLRPYSSKANILPEQTIGRGLRLMFRNEGSTYIERVDVIGNKTFIAFVEQLEREEDLQLDTFQVGKDKVSIVTIAPDPAKLDKDIALPRLSPLLVRKKTLAEEIAGLSVQTFQNPILPRKEGDAVAQQFKYEGYDILTLQKEIERDYAIPEPQTPEEVISFYAKRIAQDVKLPSQFAALVPKVREFLETKAFGETVALDSKPMIKAISSNVAHYVTVKTFAQALRGLVIEERTPQLEHAGRNLSETTPFPYSRPTLANASKCVFNLVPCDNEFERAFAKFLESAKDITRFGKLPSQFGFAIEYTDNAANLRYYEPDFVAVDEAGIYWLIETKGQENVDVAHKNRAATLWCENATLLTGTSWQYLIVHQKEYEKLQPDLYADLLALTNAAFAF
jgi:type III restriction enzyme